MDPVFQKQVNLLLRILPDLAKDRRYAPQRHIRLLEVVRITI